MEHKELACPSTAARTAAAKRYAAGFAEMGGKELLVSCSDDFTLCLWDPTDGKKPIARMTGHQAVVNHISFSPGTLCGELTHSCNRLVYKS